MCTNLYIQPQSRYQKIKLKNSLVEKSFKYIYVVYKKIDLPSKFLAYNYLIKQNKQLLYQDYRKVIKNVGNSMLYIVGNSCVVYYTQSNVYSVNP